MQAHGSSLVRVARVVPAVPSAVTTAVRRVGGRGLPARLVAGTVDGRVLHVDVDRAGTRMHVAGEAQLGGGPVFSLCCIPGRDGAAGESVFAGTARRGVVDLGGRVEDLRGHTGWVRSLLSLEDGDRLLSVGCQWLRLWDARSGANCGMDVPQARGDVLATAVSVAAGQASVLTASTDATVRRFSLDSPTGPLALSAEVHLPLPAHLAAAGTPSLRASGRRAPESDLSELVRVGALGVTRNSVVAGDNKGQLFTLDPVSLDVRGPCLQLPGPITSIAVGDDDGESLVVGGSFGLALVRARELGWALGPPPPNLPLANANADANDDDDDKEVDDEGKPGARCVVALGDGFFAAGMQDGALSLLRLLH